nr:unnamed protein product [Digitaria exilis]
MATAGGEIAAAGCTGFGWEEEHSGLEPFFFDEAAVRAEHAAAQAAKEKLREKEARERKQLSLKQKAHRAVINQIRDYDNKQGGIYYTRFCLEDFSKFEVNIICSDVGFPINVYGTVIARDCVDFKCVYLFRRNRDDSELINSEDETLTLTGPKRALVLLDDAYVEIDLKIKGHGEQKDKEFSKAGGLLQDQNSEELGCNLHHLFQGSRTGDGAQTGVESSQVAPEQGDDASLELPQKRQRTGEAILTILGDMRTSFSDVFKSTEPIPLPQVTPPAEILAKLQMIPDLARCDMLKSYGKLILNERLFQALMELPMDMRKEWILMLNEN